MHYPKQVALTNAQLASGWSAAQLFHASLASRPADKKSKKRSSQSAAPAQPDVFVGLYAGPTIER